MTMNNDQDCLALFVSEASRHGIAINQQQCNQFAHYAELLVEWNSKVNLTAITEPHEIFIKHFLDSLLAMPYCKLDGNIKLIDVGTGAGFPGLPLKIMQPMVKLTLLDALQKRVNFLETVANEIGLTDIEYLHGRAEVYANKPLYREQYDLVVSRAVANLNVLSEYCLPYVKKGGFFIAYKGPNVKDELINAHSAIARLGGKFKQVAGIKLGNLYGERSLVIIEKVSETPGKYPRREGTPSKKPLS